jgi:hypothetical protein
MQCKRPALCSASVRRHGDRQCRARRRNGYASTGRWRRSRSGIFFFSFLFSEVLDHATDCKAGQAQGTASPVGARKQERSPSAGGLYCVRESEGICGRDRCRGRCRGITWRYMCMYVGVEIWGKGGQRDKRVRWRARMKISLTGDVRVHGAGRCAWDNNMMMGWVSDALPLLGPSWCKPSGAWLGSGAHSASVCGPLGCLGLALLWGPFSVCAV